MGAFYKFLKKYHMEKWFRKDNLIVMVLAGILLAVIAIPTKEEENREEERQTMLQLESEIGAINYEAPEEPAEKQEDTLDYVSKLEQKLEALLSKIEGAGEVYVMIALQESEELVVEKDRGEESENTVYQSEGNSAIPYVIKTIYPKVEGVAVVAEGAGTGRVTQHITEVVQALFNLEPHKVKVTGS